MKTFLERRNIRVIAVVVILALGLGALLIPQLVGSPVAADGLSQVDTPSAGGAARAVATIGDLSSEISAAGEITTRQAASLALMIGGTVAETPVEVGDSVSAGDVLLRLESGELERAVEQARQTLLAQEASLAGLTAEPSAAELAAAEAAVRSAQARLDDLLDGPGEEEIAAAEADLRAAQADVGAASARLNSATAPADESALRAAQIEVDSARAAATTAAEQHSTILVTEPNQFLDADRLASMEEQARAAAQQANAALAAAQEAYDALVNGDPASVAARQASVASSAAQRDVAQAQLDLLLAGATATDIASARASLAQAELQLEQLTGGPDEATLTSAEVAVEQARIRLQQAERNLAEATLVAPFDGVVTAVNVRPSETASGIVIEMVNLGDLELILEVDEIDIAQIAPGQPAQVTLGTWPDVVIPAEVTAIVPQPVSGTDMVIYPVYLRLGETDLAVRAGMTADATLTVGELDGALLLPNEAIQTDRSNGTYTVRRIVRDANGAETVEIVEVSIGRRSGGFTQITGGLTAGDEVEISNDIPLSDISGGGQSGGGSFGDPGN